MRCLTWAACLSVALFATPAYAHSPVPGIEGFYVGLVHPFSTPAQALLMIGLGLLIGAVPASQARIPLICFLIATFLGAAIWTWLEDIDPALFTVACVASALAALLPGKYHYLVIALAAAGGLLIGMASMPDPGPVRDRAFTLSGALVGANVGLVYLAGAAILIRQKYPEQWVGIALRILAAWVATVALLMLALTWQ